MSKSKVLLIGCVGLILLTHFFPVSAVEDGFKPLLNGTDLSGWYAKDGKLECWQFADGMLSCMAEGGGWLTTNKVYSDFVLRIEWRVPPEGNSGVGIRYPEDGDPAHVGMEIQILDDSSANHKDIKDMQHTGSIYYQVAAKPGAVKPAGQWNQYEITCCGPQVTVKLNGIVVVDANLDHYPTANGEYTPLKDRPRSGHIGVQSHGSRIDFRNLEIKELP